MLNDLQGELKGELERSRRKLDYADLYSKLLTEWLSSDATSLANSIDDASTEGEFEVVEKQRERLCQLSEKFESVVFNANDVDVEAIKQLLARLFKTDAAAEALSNLRKRISGFGERTANSPKPFTSSVLEWCINRLLQNDLLSEEKKSTLEEFIKDKVVLGEISDVLNMRFADLEGWSWDADEGISVAPRRQLNGKYRVVMVRTLRPCPVKTCAPLPNVSSRSVSTRR